MAAHALTRPVSRLASEWREEEFQHVAGAGRTLDSAS
jgi:hypothetical protein